ncbi:MAG: ribonuclease HII [Candidatus Gastranaerophilales bacterium]|nr:ribonuclease HII [Candidatus Gastranaerophilales bacterium]
MLDTMAQNKLFEYDKSFDKTIIGTDEAGRGPAAGGVFASAVYFNNLSTKLIDKLSILNDSKQLSQKKREYLYDIIKNETINATFCIEVDEIEKNNILNCSLKAMKLSTEGVISHIKDENILVLADGNRLIKNFCYPQQFVIKGDGKSASIAAASILAKVARDRYMQKLDEEFPQYLWKQNAGYLTQAHLDAIDKYGLTKYHRKSFLKKHFEKQLKLF